MGSSSLPRPHLRGASRPSRWSGLRLGPLVSGLLALVTLALIAPDAAAIPAFARRYETACSTCHVQFPKLNNFGEAFRRNGYRFPTEELAQLKQAPLPLVAPARRELFPYSDWPTDIAPFPPITLILSGVVPIQPNDTIRPEGEEIVTFDRLFRSATLVAGARFGEDVAFFGELGLSPKEGVSYGRGFLVLSNLFGGPWMHLRVGQLEPQVVSFSSSRRLGGPAYRMLGDALRPSGWALEPLFRGLDLSGTLGGRIGYDLGYGQGALTSSLGDPLRQVPRDLYGHLYGKLGGLRLDGVEETGDDQGEVSLLLGAFYFRGKHTLDARKTADDPPDAEDDTFHKAGVDANARLGSLELLVAGSVEHHDFDTWADATRLQGLAEASFAPFRWLSGTLRWEVDDLEQGFARRRLVPLVTVTPRLNLRAFAFANVDQDSALDATFRVSEIDLGAAYAF
jgi:hypothetical protein